ncbi:hypothetical protein IWQ61_010053, partial [Dispira simplex]
MDLALFNFYGEVKHWKQEFELDEYVSPFTGDATWGGHYFCSNTPPTNPEVFKNTLPITSSRDFTVGETPETGKLYNKYFCYFATLQSYDFESILAEFPDQAVVAYMEVL